MAGPTRRDLVGLVADKNMEFALRGLLGRAPALGIREVTADVITHVQRDPGCLRNGHELLRSYTRSHRHALLMFDLEGCGSDAPAGKLIEAVEGRLSRSGWGERAAAVVFDPELEIWVWSDSPHVEAALGWAGRRPDLRSWLRTQGYLGQGRHKPDRPKEAMESAMRVVRRPRSSSVFEELARRVGLSRCTDPAFARFRAILREWFPRKNRHDH